MLPPAPAAACDLSIAFFSSPPGCTSIGREDRGTLLAPPLTIDGLRRWQREQRRSRSDDARYS
eukprot:6383272-Prymnesium_polylepis.1